jgi:hypothetical protein
MFGLHRAPKSSPADGICAFRWIVSALAALLVVSAAAGCGSDVEGPEPDPDPMEMRRYFPAAEWDQQPHPAVRLVNPKTPNGQQKPMIIASNVYRLPAQDALAADVDDESVTVPLERREWLLDREVGDIVISEENGIYWRRITDISVDNGQVRWTTEAAEMTDVFQQADFYLQIDTRKIDPKSLGELDLAMPYLQPERAPQLDTRQLASCPDTPKCGQASGGDDRLCVYNANPEVRCETNALGGCPEGCSWRPACVTSDDPWEACPGPENDGDPDPRDSCDTFEGPCQPALACNSHNAAVQAYSEDVYPTVSGELVGEPFGIEDFQCEHVVDRPLCVVKTCEDNSECANYKQVVERDDNGDPVLDDDGEPKMVEERTDGFPEAFDSTGQPVRGYACEKIGNGENCAPVGAECDGVNDCCSLACGHPNPNDPDDHRGDDYKECLPIQQGGSGCNSVGQECSGAGDCCSQNCGTVEVPKLDSDGEVILDANGDPELEEVDQCKPSETGWCAPGCEEGNEDEKFEGDSLLKQLLKDMILGDVGIDTGLGEYGSSGQFLEDFFFDFNFKPTITFGISIDWFKLKQIKLIVGTDFLARLGFQFKFDEQYDYDWQGEKEITIFTFTILGYPFDVKLNIHGNLLLSVAAQGTFEPQVVFYTHRANGEEWSESNNELTSPDPPSGYEGEPLPGAWQSGGDAGMSMGMIWGDDPCGDYPESEEWECDSVTGKFYKVSRTVVHRLFDPGIDATLDASATASVGVNVGIYDKGLFNGSRIIGIEPFNLLATARATIYEPFCSIGASVYFRMFVLAGPLEFLGKTLFPEVKFPILIKRIWGQNWLIPRDLGLDCGDGGDDEGHWGCILLAELGCGTLEPDEGPMEEPDFCDGSTDCGPDQRCVNSTCVEQRDQALRVTMHWTGRNDLDLQVRPSGASQVLTHRDTAKIGEGGCSPEQGCFEPTCGGPNASAPEGSDIDCSLETKYVESLIIENPSAEHYRIWVINNGGSGTGFSGSYNIEIEYEGHVEHISGLLTTEQSNDPTMTPIQLVYELP